MRLVLFSPSISLSFFFLPLYLLGLLVERRQVITINFLGSVAEFLLMVRRAKVVCIRDGRRVHVNAHGAVLAHFAVTWRQFKCVSERERERK